jgi:hypothetical protein
VRRGVPRDDANWRSLPEGAQISFAAPDWTRQDEALTKILYRMFIGQLKGDAIKC